MGFFKVFTAHSAKICHWDGVILQRNSGDVILQKSKYHINLYVRDSGLSRIMFIFAITKYKNLFLYPANDQEHERYNRLFCGYMSFGRLAGTALEFVFRLYDK